MEAKLSAMLLLQNEFNKKVNLNWVTAVYRWDHAILCEATELMEHVGYKWWKKQEPDMNQMIMELVDIWHFGMSFDLINSFDDEDQSVTDNLDWIIGSYINSIEDAADHIVPFNANSFKDNVTQLVNHITNENPWFSDDLFFTMWYSLGLNLDDLYKRYIGKNALNEFRQLNGYKNGTYIKIWHGEEDNEHLTRILESTELNENLYQSVLDQLTAKYSIVKNA